MKILEGTRSALPFTAAALLLLGTAVPALSQDGSNSSGTTTTLKTFSNVGANARGLQEGKTYTPQ